MIDPTRRVRHVKRGTEYDVIGTALVQCLAPIADDQHVVLYRGDDGQIWARPIPEFEDGRFENVEPAALPDLKGDKDALIEALIDWWAERQPNDPGDARLMKAIWSYEGDHTEPCPECDGDCGEPCAPCTVAAAHASLDQFSREWLAKHGIVGLEGAGP